MGWIKKLYYKLFPTYREVDIMPVSYEEGDKMIKESIHRSKENQWVLSKLEDTNTVYGVVVLCKKIRIWE